MRRIAGVGREPVEQPRAGRLLGGLERRDLGRRLRRLDARPRHLDALRHELRPQALQPLAQRRRRPAVVRVVGLHGRARFRGNRRRRLTLERQLDHLHLRRRVVERHRPREPVELLELLDRVALHAGAQRLPHHGVQVHEALGAQQPVQLVAAGGVPAHQPLERGRLVVPEVIHVQAGMLGPRLHHGVDDGFERRALLDVVVGPERAIALGRPQPEQILAPALAGEARALQVQEHVAGRRLRQPGQAQARRHRQQHLVHRRARRALLMLHPRLLAQADVGVPRAALRGERDRQRHRRRRGQRAVALRGQLGAVPAADAGDERQVVVGPPPLVAALIPAAQSARLDRFGIVRVVERGWPARQDAQQFGADPADEGGEVVQAVGCGCRRGCPAPRRGTVPAAAPAPGPAGRSRPPTAAPCRRASRAPAWCRAPRSSSCRGRWERRRGAGCRRSRASHRRPAPLAPRPAHQRAAPPACAPPARGRARPTRSSTSSP